VRYRWLHAERVDRLSISSFHALVPSLTQRPQSSYLFQHAASGSEFKLNKCRN